MRKFTFVLRAISAFTFVVLMSVSNLAIGQCLSGTLEGRVYHDTNFNGIDDSEDGVSGVFVRVYNSSGQVMGQAMTGNNGIFSVQGHEDGAEYRVVYDVPSDNYVSAAGPNNATEVQFVTVPFCKSELGIVEGTDNCDAGTELFLTCFVNGLGSNSPNQETVIGINHDFNAGSPVNVYANQSETGAVWGIAYKSSTEELFTSAFIKQNASLTTHGHDAIFTTNVGDATPSTNLFAKLSSLGQQVGTLIETDSDNCNYGSQVGMYGIGGISLDDTGDNLYVANLYNNTIVKINTNNPTAQTTDTYLVPNPGCSFNDYRIFATKVYNGNLYVGVTCTGETSLDDNDVAFHVFKKSLSGNNFTLIFSTNYAEKAWDNSDRNQHSTLWLKDIDFTDNDHMILGIADRIGDVYCKGTTNRVDDQFGDILMVYNDNGTWTLESNGTAGTRTGTGQNNGQGPDGGEFFGDDFFPKDPSDNSEVSLGSIYAMPHTNEVVTTVYNPLFNTYSGGLHRYSTINGQKTGSQELYNHDISDYFGKASGFGDIVARCGTLPIEIGNLVWIDSNNNGTQDAGERVLSGEKIIICNSDCEEIGSTVTDSKGNYVFNNTNVDIDGDGTMDGLVEGDTYYIAIDPTLFDHQSLSYILDDNFYYPAIANANESINSNLVTNLVPCESPNSKNIPMVEVIAAKGNNPTFDLGLVASTEFDLALMKTTSANGVRIGEIVDFEITVYNQGGVTASEFEIVDYLTPAYEFSEILNPNWTKVNGLVKNKVKTFLTPGASHTETIRLKVVDSNNPIDYINEAEIAYALDYEGKLGLDEDSVSDTTKNNDRGGDVDTPTDDEINDDGTNDEDDHDPAKVKVLDLALINIIRDDRNYDTGEQVTFDMTVYNQGNVATNSFDVINQFPESLRFAPSLNNGWTQTTGSTVTTTYDGVLEPGESVELSVTFILIDNNDFRNIVNYAEISGFEAADPTVLVDFDSNPDILLNNDNGGDPYGVTDNMIDDHGTIDEDDHDPAFIRVRMIDLALIKQTKTKVHNPGEDAEFEITVINQGDITIRSVVLVDYLPEQTTVSDNSWTVDPNDNTGRTVYKNVIFNGGLAPSDTHKETITLNIEENISAGIIVNEAEIAQVIDINGVDISDHDIDSQADMEKDNDAGGEVDTEMDDKIDGNGMDDEDDHDPAALYIATIDAPYACSCLDNATNQLDGQFSELIVVTAPTGQTWNVDYALNIYNDITSLFPPNAPTPFVTGDAGYQLSESPLGDGTSEYYLTGRIIDDTPYSVRVYNEDAAYLQYSGGGSDCEYEDLVISSPDDGLSAVCTGSIKTYEVDSSYPCISYSWSVEGGGGTIVGPSSGTSVQVHWTVPGGPYNVVMDPLCPSFCFAPVRTAVNVGLGDGAMACRHDINVSLGLDCMTEVEPELILTNPQGGGIVYQVMLTDAHGHVIPNNILTEDQLWKNVTAKVINPYNGNSCWANIYVEDKMPPVIQCDDIEMPCWQMDSYEPIVYDNCTNATYSLINETIEPFICDDDYIKEVTRTYVAVDEFGNQSEECTQTILLERIDLDEIDWPEHFMLLNDTNLSCSDSLYDENGYPRIEITGVPRLSDFDLYPFPDVYCNVGVDYSDFLVTEFGCVKKLMRTWTVYENWCTVGRLEQFTQTIEIVDTFDPEVECPADIEVSSDGGATCSATVTIPLPTITDDCSTEFEIDISYVGGFLDNVTEPQTVTLPAGVNEIIFTVYDGCENSATCTMYVTVIDNAPPVAVCDQNTIVSLRSDGTAKAFAHTFDDGSYDDCNLYRMLVRRMGSNCDCKVPVYNDMKYLGERNGRYYYLSNFKTQGFKAFAFSEAFGGFLAALESEEEHDWVYDKVSQEVMGNYYIGLSDEMHQGDFTWANHAAPTYNQWFNGAPLNVGDHVVVDANGYWQVVNGEATEAYFVMEVSDPCTFSNEVHFCCPDVAEDQMVVFRAIDFFGQYNDCMVNVEVQDKVAPEINCPPDLSIDCTVVYDLNDLSVYGTATATDVCGVTITETASDTINICRVGSITRTFVAADLNGSSTCDQKIYVVNNHPFNPLTIIWPQDFDSDQGCGSGDLHPDNLPFINGRPQFTTDECDQVAATWVDQTFSFAGQGVDACLKILRTWTVIDWCEMDSNPNYEPAIYEQTIKIINTDGPTIISGCDTLTITTLDCDMEDVMFTVVADDDCTPLDMLDAKLELDEDSDGDFDYTDDIFGNVLSFDGTLGIGEHFALASFEDMCGNKTTCAKIIRVINVKNPTAACKEGLSVALVPMDLDDDGIPDTEMTCIFPEMIDASSTHMCGLEINLSFSADTTDDKKIFDCDDLGPQEVCLWVTDEFGNTDKCVVTVEVQDNNMVDFCPRFDLALIKTRDTVATPGPFMVGDDVAFNLEVINQGNIPAYDIELVDYIPDGLILNDAGWTENPPGLATYNTIIPFLEDSTSTTVSINFTIDPNFNGDMITNIAEISAADDDNDPNTPPMDDSDSDSDSTDDDTIGGDDVTDNSNGDEDDHDPADIAVDNFDLAITKVINQAQTPAEVNPGDNVVFTITVHNQGTLDATDVRLEDYVPSGMVFNPGDNSDFVGGGSVTASIPLVVAGGEETLSLTLQVSPSFTGSMLVNNVEIKAASNILGFPDEDDLLSNMNDGSTNELATDNDIDDDAPFEPGTADNPNDEDDYDPAKVDVVCDLPPNCEASNIEVFLDANGNASITVVDIDNGSSAVCDEGNPLDLSIDINSFDCDDLGSGNIVTLTVTDDLGNDSSCTADVTVTDDTPPTVQCVDITTTLDQNNQPVISIATVTGGSEDDNCLVDDVSIDMNTIPNPYDPCDIVTVTLIVTDNSNNTGTCEFDVTIENEPPMAVCEPGFEVQLNANGEAVITAGMVDDGSNDDCTFPNDLDLSIDQSNFDCSDIGMVTVTLTVTDEAGQTDTCTSEITVVDQDPPTANCQDITVGLNINGLRNISDEDINDGSFDNCTVDLDLDLSKKQFNCDDITMMNIVTLTVTDAQGNTSTCTAMVTVEDNRDPTVDCVPDFTVSLDGNGEAMITVGDIIDASDDNCEVASEVIDISLLDCTDIGPAVTITATVSDPSGNTATCSTDVTVEDNEAPDCTLLMNVDIPVNTPIDLADIFDTYSDNCNSASAMTTINPSQYDCNMLGMQLITVTVTDDSGNESTCTEMVTVEDVDEPICEAQDITVELDDMGMVMIDAADIDNGSSGGCSMVTLEVDPDEFFCNAVGMEVVTLTVTSDNGMSSTCTATVTIEDNMDPSAVCVPDFTVNVNNNGNANITVGDVIESSDDECGIQSEVIDISSFDCDDKAISPILVTATVTDNNGNTTTCTVNVSVDDVTDPECTLFPDLEFVPDVTITINDVLNTFTDNCATGNSSITSQTEFTCDDIGTHVVTVEVDDACGNTATCTTEIEIIDDENPICMAQDITVSLDANGEYDLDASEVDDGSAAVCGGDVVLEIDPNMFDCGDIGSVVVTLTVTSSGGGESSCTATVTIVDDMPPTIVCPQDFIVICDEDLSDLTQFGTATADDNCDSNVSIIVNNVFDVNSCNIGSIERTFTATDDEGNSSTCVQTITINGPNNPVTENDITWPMTPFDAGDCIADPSNIDSGEPIVDTSNAECFNISISFSDFDPTPGLTCNDQIERTWTVVDSCQLNGGGAGIFTFLQIINLNDSVGPTIDGPMDTLIFLDPMSVTCDTFINLPATITDCVAGFSATNDSPFADDNSTEDASGTYPMGSTPVTITAVDTCGNESMYTYNVTVIDSTAEIISCSKIIATIDMNLEAIVTVDQPDLEITSNCADSLFTLSFSNTDPTQDTLIFGCADIGIANYTIYLYAGNFVVDSCTNLLQVHDGGGFCPSAFNGTIAGSIYTEDDRMVDEVWVDLLGSPFASIPTDTDGHYIFPEMPFGGSYEVLPQKDVNPLNGVTTLDLIEIQRHILGIKALDSPYKYIAADIDRSGSITTSDLLELRKMILGHYETFPNNTSWRMVDAGYEFIDEYDPFAYDIPEEYQINSFDNSMLIDFIGVKVGDVNNSAVANIYDNGVEGRSLNTFDFVLAEEKLVKGDIHELNFGAENMDKLDGYQLTIEIDPNLATITGFEPVDQSMSMDNVNLNDIDNGLIHISWHKLGDYSSSLTDLFKVTVQLKTDTWVSELSTVHDTGLRSEAYESNSIKSLGFDYRTDHLDNLEMILYQNQPNPWLESTTIKYYSPSTEEVALNIYDVNGRLVHTKRNLSSEGLNKILIRKSDVNTAHGILYYELIQGETRLMEKMLLLK